MLGQSVISGCFWEENSRLSESITCLYMSHVIRTTVCWRGGWLSARSKLVVLWPIKETRSVRQVNTCRNSYWQMIIAVKILNSSWGQFFYAQRNDQDPMVFLLAHLIWLSKPPKVLTCYYCITMLLLCCHYYDIFSVENITAYCPLKWTRENLWEIWMKKNVKVKKLKYCPWAIKT